MKNLGTILSLLLLTFDSYSFVESTESKTQDKDLTFNAYLAVADIDLVGDGLSKAVFHIG